MHRFPTTNTIHLLQESKLYKRMKLIIEMIICTFENENKSNVASEVNGDEVYHSSYFHLLLLHLLSLLS